MEHGPDEAPTPIVFRLLERRVSQRRRRKVEPSEALLLMVADEGEGGVVVIPAPQDAILYSAADVAARPGMGECVDF